MLYTGKGDNGTTKLFGCTGRIAKSDERVALLGNLDELNSYLGYCRAVAFGKRMGSVREALLHIQEDLFVIQASVAGAPKTLSPERLSILEDLIQGAEREMEPIRSFTIPGTTVLSSALDVARTIARRTERSMVAVGEASLENIIPYLNRLSSALFALARLSAHRAGVKEQAPSY